MQKMNHKSNKKIVGATSSRTHFKENTKGKKGITLIALIITIIVMLILVGVTVNVALNGGLFDVAKRAASKTQKEADKEFLQSEVLATYDVEEETVDTAKLKSNLETAEWEVTLDENLVICASPKGSKFKLVIEENGSFEIKDAIIEVPEATEEIAQVIRTHAGDARNANAQFGYVQIGEKIYYDRFLADKTLFTEVVPTEGNINATLTNLDGTTQNIVFEKNSSGDFVCSLSQPIPYSDVWKEGDDPWTITMSENENRYIFIIDGLEDTQQSFRALTMLGGTLYFESMFAEMYIGAGTLYENLDNVSRVILNYEDSTQDEFIVTEPDQEGMMGKSGSRAITLPDGFFIIFHMDCKEMDILENIKKIKTITIEENSIMTTYKMAEDVIYIYSAPGS